MAVVAGGLAGGLLDGLHLLQPVLVAEAVVGVARLHQLLGVVDEHPHPLALHIGAHRAADVRAFIPPQAALAQGAIDDVLGPLDLALLIGVLDAQDEGAAVFLGHQIGVQGGAQVAHVHVAGGAGCKPGANFAFHSLYHLFFSSNQNCPAAGAGAAAACSRPAPHKKGGGSHLPL